MPRAHRDVPPAWRLSEASSRSLSSSGIESPVTLLRVEDGRYRITDFLGFTMWVVQGGLDLDDRGDEADWEDTGFGWLWRPVPWDPVRFRSLRGGGSGGSRSGRGQLAGVVGGHGDGTPARREGAEIVGALSPINPLLEPAPVMQVQ